MPSTHGLSGNLSLRFTLRGLVLGAALAGCSGGAATEHDTPGSLDQPPPSDPAGTQPVPDRDDEEPEGTAPVPPPIEQPPAVIDPITAACAGQTDCRWSARADLPAGSRSHAAAEYSGAIYVFGGMTAADTPRSSARPGADTTAPLEKYRAVRAYSPEANSWTPRASMPVGLYSSTAHALGDAIYVVGGYGEQGFTGALQRYSPASDSWTELSPRPLARYTFMSEVVGGRIYVTGGMGPFEIPTLEDAAWEGKTSLEIYDPATDTWTEGTPAPQALSDGASCALGDRIFFMGGELANATLIYDVGTELWSEGAPAPTTRGGMSCARVGDSFYLLGGRDGGRGHELDRVERYDVTSDSWQEYKTLPTPRYWFSTVALGTSIYSIGGERLDASVDFGLLRSVEVLTVAP
jgi:N-acetylneuraminic acid mutarotase